MKYTREMLVAAVAKSTSMAGVMRELSSRPSGGLRAHLRRRIDREGIDTSHFLGRGHGRGTVSNNRLSSQAILILRPAGSPRTKPRLLRRALIESGVHYSCQMCGLAASWNGKPLCLHVDHEDGNYLDSRIHNLRFLCPNCHSQTENWAGRNRGRAADADNSCKEVAASEVA